MPLARFCQACGAELPRAERAEAGTERAARRQCRRCGVAVEARPAAGCAGILLREGPRGPELLLVRRAPDLGTGPGLWCIPCGYVEWGEDVRDGVRRELKEETGLEVDVLDVYDVRSNFHEPESLTVGCWFRTRLRDASVEPHPGDDADRAEFFPLAALPTDLAFENDRRVIERLRRETRNAQDPRRHANDVEAALGEAESRLERRRQKYRDLLELYTNELMRGAWLNDLLLRLSKSEGTAAIATEAVMHLASQRGVEQVRAWMVGPPDVCDTCPWRDRCPRERCLHLVAHSRGTENPASSGSHSLSGPDENARLPLVRGVPAAEVVLKGQQVRAEVDTQSAFPQRFEGFPIEAGSPANGVVGVFSRAPLDTNARRLCEIVTRHSAALLRSARLVADLTAANKAKSAFIARMSHELKTPLTAILGFAELLREDRKAAGDEMGADGAATIEQSGRQLLGIVESILEIAKLESGAVQLSPERTDVAALVRACRDRWEKRALEKGLVLELAEPLPSRAEATVWADAARIEKVLDELVSNAVKFTREGRVRLALAAGAEQVAVEVRDTGIGISAAQRERLFQPFGQDESIHIEYGGLGIGLAVAKTLVELHGGRVGVESTAGTGSCFTVTLPKTARTAG